MFTMIFTLLILVFIFLILKVLWFAIVSTASSVILSLTFLAMIFSSMFDMDDGIMILAVISLTIGIMRRQNKRI